MSQQDNEAAVQFTKSAIEIAEQGCADVIKGIVKGFNLGMLNKIERDTLVNDMQAVKHNILSIHSRLTGIAQREGADGVIITGGPGR